MGKFEIFHFIDQKKINTMAINLNNRPKLHIAEPTVSLT